MTDARSIPTPAERQALLEIRREAALLKVCLERVGRIAARSAGCHVRAELKAWPTQSGTGVCEAHVESVVCSDIC